MSTDNFLAALKNFLFAVRPAHEEIIRTEFRIEIQPGMVSFDGEFIPGNKESIPADLEKIGKSKCSNLAKEIEEFHKATMNNGENKWNKASITINSDGQTKTELIWDEQLEQDNVNAYKRHLESDKNGTGKKIN